MEARHTLIPNYIKASSPLGLRRLMLMTAAKIGGQISFFDIQYVTEPKSKYWIAWYYHEVQNDDPLLTGQGE